MRLNGLTNDPLAIKKFRRLYRILAGRASLGIKDRRPAFYMGSTASRPWSISRYVKSLPCIGQPVRFSGDEGPVGRTI